MQHPERFVVGHAIVRDEQDDPVATAEQMLLHVDAGSGRTSPVADPVRVRLAALAAARDALPGPQTAGRGIAL